MKVGSAISFCQSNIQIKKITARYLQQDSCKYVTISDSPELSAEFITDFLNPFPLCKADPDLMIKVSTHLVFKKAAN